MRRYLVVPAALLATWIASVQPAFAQSGVTVSEENFVIVPDSSHHKVQVLEQWTFSKTTERTLELGVPANATNITVMGTSAGNIKSKSGFIRVGVQGQNGNELHEIVSFELPWQGSNPILMDIQEPYAASTASLLVPVGGWSINAPGLLVSTETETIGTTNYRVLTRPSINSNTDWTISLIPPGLKVTGTQAHEELPAPVIGYQANGDRNTKEAVFNLLVALLILVIGLLGISRLVVENPKIREHISRRLLVVEELYQRGDIDRSTYIRRRDRLLRTLWKKGGGIS